LAPAWAERERLQSEERKLALPEQQAPAPVIAADGEAPAPPGKLPPPAEVLELFDRLQAAGEKNAVTIERATYNVIRHEQHAALQYEVNLPLRGSYPNLRQFLREALELAPSASLDSLNLQRTKASYAALEASVRISYFFHLK
ncbi:MAG: hypothetical protein JNK59_04475, partial [Sterolibacteriaceae bacterium]|nr:hypothetical protein [Sterolibacteriaceae bacterium]